MPFVSVIIPCYRAKENIIPTLAALEAQTFRDFDVILVDDCSPDGTYDFLCEAIQEYTISIRVIKNKKNTGPAGARNLGISFSTAEYIAFCDSDDTYELDYLQKMVAAVKDGTDMVFCNHKKLTPIGEEIARTSFPKKFLREGSSKQTILTLDVDALWMILIRRTIIAETPIPNLRNGEDMAVIPLLILKSERFAFVDDCLYNYVCYPGSLSTCAGEKVTSSLIASYAHLEGSIPARYKEELEFLGIRNLLYATLLNHFKYTKDKSKPKEILSNFEYNHPLWHKNRYLTEMPVYKRIFLRLAKWRMFFCVRILARIHQRLTEKR